MKTKNSYTLQDFTNDGFTVIEAQRKADNLTHFVVLKKYGSRFAWVTLSNDGENWSEPRKSDVLI